MKTKAITFILIMATAVNAVEYLPIAEADLPNPAVSISLTDDGSWEELIINDWQDVVSTSKGQHQYKYQQGYNYIKKQGFIRTYELDGSLVNEKYSIDYDGRMTKEEMLVAYDLFKNHPIIKSKLAKFKEPIILQGGFNFADGKEGMPCYKGMRCVHVFANTESKSLVAHSVVRMTDRTIPYPEYDHQKSIQPKK